MKYFAMIDGEQRGPFDLEELADAGVTPDTYVWHKGLADWQQAGEDAEICRHFRRRLTSLMHPEPQAAHQPAEVQTQPGRFSRYGIELPKEIVDTEQFKDHSVKPRSLLISAIIATILCFPLTGIVAIWFDSRCSKAWAEGERELAWDYHRRAKMWIGITFFVGIIINAVASRLLATL